MYYLIQDNRVYEYCDLKVKQEWKDLKGVSVDQYLADPIKYIIQGDELVDNPNYADEKAAQREEEFKNNFFEITTNMNYRYTPKGYSGVADSLNTAANIVNATGSLPAGIITYYPTPDFYNEEQCGEAWLVANSYTNEELDKEAFYKLYVTIITKYNEEVHKQALAQAEAEAN